MSKGIYIDLKPLRTDEIFADISRVIREYAPNLSKKPIQFNTRLVEDLDLDIWGEATLRENVEARYGIARIPDDVDLTTVGDIVNYLWRSRGQSSSTRRLKL